MHKRFLPVILALAVFSCTSPAENSSNADSTSAAESVAEGEENSTPPEQDTSTYYDGNTDGDIFFTDSLKEQLDNPEMIDVRQPVIDVCGFSGDGNYFAFTQYLTGEGADGTGYVFVIDVAKNEWAKKPDMIESIDDLETELAKVRDRVLKQYDISYQQYTGKEYNIRVDNKVMIEGRQYKVDLSVENLLIDLRVKGNGKEFILQKDKKLPSSRGSVREYRLNKAYVLGDRIAAFVEYDGDIDIGFENYRYYDRKNIVVTGVVK